jgi:HbrB-like
MDAPLHRPERLRSSSRQNQRPPSSGSDTSTGSNLTSISMPKRTAYGANPANLSSYIASNIATANSSQTSLPNYSRPAAHFMPHSDQPTRKGSPLGAPFGQSRHQRQHSQGYFEPSMPSASLADHSSVASLSASQIAAQAAMQQISMSSHARKRSQTAPSPQESAQEEGRKGSKSSPPPLNAGSDAASTHAPVVEQQYRNGLIGNTAAATAANVAFPRSLISSDGPEKEQKKGSKMRMFKPKHIGITRDRDKEAKDRPLASPNKLPAGSSALSRVVNASTTSLADSLSSSNTLYTLNNASSSTMIPVPPSERQASYEKEKSHKHTGLRQKLKLKDKDDHHNLPLSSANSNSKPLDSDNPSSLYSFEPSSPGLNSNFSKSVSGLDLRHAGRALREKKREAKALANNSTLEATKSRESETSEWPLSNTSNLSTSLPQSSTLGTSGAMTPVAVDPALRDILSTFGLNNMTPDDAWDFLKAKILVVFEGEDVRVAVEDLNKLVTIYTQRCVQRHQPTTITEDLDDLFQTGFLSLNHTIRFVPDDRLVPHLVSMWLIVFQTVLPFMQAVFFPLDQEFKGRGSVLTTRAAAADFWGALPTSESAHLSTSPSNGGDGLIVAGDELEIRRILLISFRDTVILPRYDVLKAIFSRLSLESINANLSNTSSMDSNVGTNERPSTAQSLDPNLSSFNSQSSTLLGSSSAGRSRATSNTSNPAQDIAFQSLASPPAARPTDNSSAQVTETVGRMLQCISVLASIQSNDEAQVKMEELGKELKLNWLGRGRTGRNRRGFVGTRVRNPRTSSYRRDSEGSPTPTPTRAATIDIDDEKGGMGSMPGAFGGGLGRSML